MREKHSYGGGTAQRGQTIPITKHLSLIKDLSTGTKNKLNTETLKLADIILPTKRDLETRARVIEDAEKRAAAAEVAIYSTASLGITLQSTDIELFYTDENASKLLRSFLTDIAENGVVAMGGNAHPPFVSYIDKAYGYTVTLYAKSQYNEKLSHMKNILKKFPVIKKMILVLSHILRSRGLCIQGASVGEYELLLMCECFLKSHPLIQGQCIDAGKNLGVLLMDFLQLYGCDLYYDRVGIDPKRGWFVHKAKDAGYFHIVDPVDGTDAGSLLVLHKGVEALFNNLYTGMNVLYRLETALPIVSFWIMPTSTGDFWWKDVETLLEETFK
ncbi:non-canonical poly(A) RNA polymerase PAPD5/7 [Nematocida displodere]|uniref:Non-canonical poly(A) RNA polymerase PAPD5/7 n=1 Tax=Nematocida displodere TaxID=1805483 RepID=A0A177EMK8_9MICR|nr:non-canonical poly(A) RNA polymerase PAPD5/7 [Nematocida displodere]